MKGRWWAVFILTIGLALLVPWAVASQGATGTTVDHATLPSTSHDATGSGRTSDFDFRIYLPGVFRGYLGCTTLPTLISPENGSTLNTIIPLYVWDRGTNPAATGLRLQVATDEAFSHLVNTLGSYGDAPPQFRFTSNLVPATTYYWRAQLICGSMRGPYTDVWTFMTGFDGTVLPAPALLAPTNGATTAGTRVTVQWATVPGALGYALFWRKASEVYPGFEWLDATQRDTTWAKNTTYVWWAAARNDYAIGAESEHWQFTTPASSSDAIEGMLRGFVLDQSGGTIVLLGAGSGEQP